jgi:arsenate reductase
MEKKLIIYHNGRCSKSRDALSLLEELGVPYDVRWYMQEPFKPKELKGLLKKLKMSAAELVRRKEPLFLENFKGKEFSEDEWIDILIENPSLIERPIAELGRKALVARPAERIKELL